MLYKPSELYVAARPVTLLQRGCESELFAVWIWANEEARDQRALTFCILNVERVPVGREALIGNGYCPFAVRAGPIECAHREYLVDLVTANVM